MGGECSLEGVVGGGRLQKYTWVYCTGHVGQMGYTYIRQSGSHRQYPTLLLLKKI